LIVENYYHLQIAWTILKHRLSKPKEDFGIQKDTLTIIAREYYIQEKDQTIDDIFDEILRNQNKINIHLKVYDLQ
jgi:hypothetical protein